MEVTMTASPDSSDLGNFTSAIARSAGAIHNRIMDQGPQLVFPKPSELSSYVARLSELGVITAPDVEDLNALLKEVLDDKATDHHGRVTGAARRLLDRGDASPTAATIAGIAVASADRAAQSPTYGLGRTIAYDVGGAVIGGVAGGIAGSMIGGRAGGYAGAGFGAVLVGGLASAQAP
jgi:hypothetical protein